MIYLLFLLFSCLYLSHLYKYRILSSWQLYIYFLPIILFWVLLIGGQYDVGTDYFDYLRIFNGDLYYIEENRGEFVFAALVRFCNACGIYGQGVFFIISFIWILLLINIMSYSVDRRFYYIFFFVFIVFPGILHNQMNGIRQYCAIYLFTIAVCCFLKKRYRFMILFVFLMSFCHLSSIFICVIFTIALLFLNNLVRNPKWLYFIVIISLILNMSLSTDTISNILNHFSNISEIKTYSTSYMNTGRITQAGLIANLTKYLYVPIIVYAIHLYTKMELNDNEKKLFVIGICGFCFKLSLISITIVYRLGQYFDILMCIPIIYMLIYFRTQRKQKIHFNITTLYLLVPYTFKVTAFAIGEYQYHSFFFH